MNAQIDRIERYIEDVLVKRSKVEYYQGVKHLSVAFEMVHTVYFYTCTMFTIYKPFSLDR